MAASGDSAPRRSVMVSARVVEHEIAVETAIGLVTGPGCGAVSSFAGVVRDHDHGRQVTELTYVAHDSANEVIERVATAVAARHPELIALAVAHRVGTLQVGDTALVVASAAAHRAAAIAACAETVEDVKRELPVWKRQHFGDGTEEWVNCP
jgi:molybdopterin synthase catalytic subunit